MTSSQVEGDAALKDYRERNQKSVDENQNSGIPGSESLKTSELSADHLLWTVKPDPIHGASIYDAKGNQIVAHIYDEENATIIVKSVNSHDVLITERDKLLHVLETRAEREMEMLEGVARENDALRSALKDLFNMVNCALDARDALLISKTCATMEKAAIALADGEVKGDSAQ